MARHNSDDRRRASAGSRGPTKRRRNEISSIGPASRSIEGDRAYGKRTSQRDYSEMLRAKRKRKRVALVSAATVVILLVGSVLAAWAYIASVNRKMGSDVTKELTEALTERQAPQEPFYMLVMGTDLLGSGEVNSRSDTLMLMRVDPEKKALTIVSIPRDTRVEIEGHGLRKINAAAQLGGAPLVIKTVSEFAGVPISHYAQVDFAGFEDLVDTLGGVSIDVPVRIDDWKVTDVPIEPGPQVLTGEQALAFCRSRAFPTGDYQRIIHQQMFLKAVAKQVLAERDPLKLSGMIGDLAKIVRTDLTVGDLVGLAKSMSGMDVETIETVTVPSVPKMIDGVSFVIHDDAEWRAMIERIKSGLPADPEKARELEEASAAATEKATPPAEVTVAVRNGAGIEGLAAGVADKLKAAEYDVVEVGNTSRPEYDNTFVIYNEGDLADAQAIVDVLGMGKTVPSRGMYVFNTKILVVVGKDWRP